MKTDIRNRLPAPLAADLAEIERFFSAYDPRVELYIVGGAVRDRLMHRPIADLDIECYGIDPAHFEAAMAKLGAKGVGKSYFVYKSGTRIDLSLPRTETKTGRGHRAFRVTLAQNTLEASRRRDFTMNALMLRLTTGEIIDHWGGLRDIERRIIRVVDEKSFAEDSLRVLRAMQFSARLKFRIDPPSRDLMCDIPLDDLTPERIFLEFEKMFHAPWLHYGLYAMFSLGIAKKVLGLTIDWPRFFQTARQMMRVRKVEDGAMRPYYFLYILAANLKRSPLPLCEALHTPNLYKKVLAFQKRPPRRITDRFLGALALRYALRQWLGVYADNVVERAKTLGIYHRPFDPGIRPADLLEEGYTGKALGDELRRRKLTAIRRNFA